MSVSLNPLLAQALHQACLEAVDNPQQAFYRLWIEPYQELFLLCKESGGQGKVKHRQMWAYTSLVEAERVFYQRLRIKTSQQRHSARKYRLASLLPEGSIAHD